jgi:ABC-type Fe3+/spermidine/putrescine transport system ATPase subunit
VALRPEYIRLAQGSAIDGPNQFATQVEQVIYRGQHTQFLLRRPGGEMLHVIRQGGEAGGDFSLDGIGPGAAVVASWDERHNRLVRDDP